MLTKLGRNEFPSPCISVASTDLELLLYLKTTIGKGVITSKKNYLPEIHTDSFVYTIKRRNALKLMSQIIPFLRIEKKRKRAEYIISNYDKVTLRNGKYNKKQLVQKEMFYLVYKTSY